MQTTVLMMQLNDLRVHAIMRDGIRPNIRPIHLYCYSIPRLQLFYNGNVCPVIHTSIFVLIFYNYRSSSFKNMILEKYGGELICKSDLKKNN